MQTNYIMNSLYKNSLLLFSLAAFIACKKNDELLINGQYKPASTVTIDAVVMLTKEGLITNTSLIKEFVRRHLNTGDLDYYFLFDKSTESINHPTQGLTFDFKDNNMVETTYYQDQSSLTEVKIVKKTSSYIDIASMYTVQTNVSLSPGRCEILMRQATSPVLTEEPSTYVYTPNGYSRPYNYRPMTRLEIRNGELYLPFTNVLVSNKQAGAACSFANRNSYKVFNHEIAKQLQKGDTIVYQMKRVQLIKQ